MRHLAKFCADGSRRFSIIQACGRPPSCMSVRATHEKYLVVFVNFHKNLVQIGAVVSIIAPLKLRPYGAIQMCILLLLYYYNMQVLIF